MNEKEVFFYDLEQGSDEWFNFRKNLRMASETPAIMGVCKYRTLSDLFDQKIIGIQTEPNEAMLKGNIEEPIARESFSKLYNMEFAPIVCRRGDYAASLDGINKNRDVLLEIKTPFNHQSERYKKALQKEITSQDYYQIQHQLMVSGCSIGYLYVWDYHNKEGFEIQVNPDSFTQELIRDAWDSFFDSIENDEYLNIEEEEAFLKMLMALDDKKKELQRIEESLDSIKNKIKFKNNKKFFYFKNAKIKVEKVERKGIIDYKKIVEELIKDINLETYRKKESEYIKYEIKKRK